MSDNAIQPLIFADYNNTMQPTWCPACGDFAIFMALKQALVALQIPPHQIFQVWGIGCSGNMSNWVNVYGAHALHGRALPVATAAKLVNPHLTAIAEGGDGDGYGIGLAHFIHTMRRNLDITYIVTNNLIFALSSDCTYIARGFSGDVNHLKELIIGGIRHRGFALIDIFQPCVTFNNQNTYDWFKERVYKLEDVEGYTARDKEQAFPRALEWGPKIPIGLFYQEERATYTDELDQLSGPDDAVVEHDIMNVDITKSVARFG